MLIERGNVKKSVREKYMIEDVFLCALETYKECEAYYFIKNSTIIPFVKIGEKFISVPFMDAPKIELKNLRDLDWLGRRKVIVKTSDKKIVDILSKSNFLKKFAYKQHIIATNLESIEKFWKSLHKHARNDIRKAIKNNLYVKRIEDDKELRNFYRIYVKAMKSFCSLPHDIRFFEKILSFQNSYGFNCYYRGKCIASIIEITDKERGYIAFNVSSENYRKFSPNDFLYWLCIKLSIKKGLKFVDLGEVDINNPTQHARGILNFKKKYGNEVKQKFLFTNEDLEERSKMKKFLPLIRVFPPDLLKLLGPKILIKVAI